MAQIVDRKSINGACLLAINFTSNSTNKTVQATIQRQIYTAVLVKLLSNYHKLNFQVQLISGNQRNKQKNIEAS